jgi:hypothetical protein
MKTQKLNRTTVKVFKTQSEKIVVGIAWLILTALDLLLEAGLLRRYFSKTS